VAHQGALQGSGLEPCSQGQTKRCLRCVFVHTLSGRGTVHTHTIHFPDGALTQVSPLTERT
jgi:hypothetical protein